MRFALALAITLGASPSLAAQDCDSLAKAFSKFDNAAMKLDRMSRSDSSTLRAETAQSALTNILLRQGMILDMMIARDCELPDPPDFPLLGMISGHN